MSAQTPLEEDHRCDELTIAKHLNLSTLEQSLVAILVCHYCCVLAESQLNSVMYER
jgi:hypothetical protein